MSTTPVDSVAPRQRWIFPEENAPAAEILAREAHLPLLIAELLLARGIRDAHSAGEFLNPAFDQLLDPFSMLGMDRAVVRIQQAAAAREGVRLVISVDTGIRAFAAAEAAEALGLDLIVTDHHLPETSLGLPRALAILNPNQPDCTYACKHLCGAGVAFKLSQALLEALDRERARTKILPSFLKLLAIATVADAVPLLGENRVFVALGLDQLQRPVHPGLRSLMQVAKLDPARKKLTPVDIGFRLGPRINAAGRMDIASEVVELFTTKDPTRAQAIAEKLEQLNQDRRNAEAAMLTEIVTRLEDPEFQDTRCIVIDGDGWHRGIIGILASRIVDQTGKPALVLAHENGEAYGSGRSIAGFHLLNAIETCHDLFTRFGGHSHAVGFSLPSERVPQLRQRMQAYAAGHIAEEDLGSPLQCHALLPLDRITPALFAWLRKLEPMGMGNEEPTFVARNVRIAAPPRFMKERHIRLQVAQGLNGATIGALGWHWAERIQTMGLTEGSIIDLAYRLRENEHPEYGGLELEIAGLAPVFSEELTAP